MTERAQAETQVPCCFDEGPMTADCEGCSVKRAVDALVADLARYRTALEEAADDLDKAATLFDGLGFSLNTAHFAGKAERARAALAGADDQEQTT